MNVAEEIIRTPRRTMPASPLELVGTPYTRGGVTPEQGFDCYSLMAYVRWHWYGRATPIAGIPARPLTTAAACAWGIYRTLGGRDHLAPLWVECEPRDGCAVALGRRRFGRLHHCGVFIVHPGNIEAGVLHSFEQLGVCYTPAERVQHLFNRIEYYECVPE